MTKYKVRRVTEIKFTEMADEEVREIYGLRELLQEWECTCFAEGEGYVCLKDLNDTSDDRGYAVYAKSDGRLLCLLSDAGRALEGYEDWEYGEQRNELYKQIALLAGWPERMYELRFQLTWRELANEIKKIPTEFLDTPAYVYRYEGGGTLADVRGVEPWCTNIDGSVPKPGGPDDNCYYINNGFPGED